MTQVAFSHQFSQRWIDTPAEIKNALLQRLDDIVRLLDEDTDLDSFEFSIADLDAYLDDLYAQMATEIAEKQAQALAQANIEQAEAEQTKADQIEAFDVDIDEADGLDLPETSESPEALTASEVTQETAETTTEASPITSQDSESTSLQQPVSTPPAFAFENSDGELDAEFIKGLERSIDDYLSDQLSSMSEDLKAWLHEAINSRLNEQSQHKTK